MRSSRPLLALAWLVLGFLALSPAGLAREAGALVRLVAPRAGSTFAGGSMAELEWAPLARFAHLRGVEEWEAFLSLDGGSTYPVRITPHLDQDLRRIRWQVPAIPTTDARILLRFGDERRETVVELPERFAIAVSPIALPVLEETFLRAHRSSIAGEPALPGHAGAIAWVEGSRRGGSLSQVVAAERPDLQAQPDLTARHAEAIMLASGPAPPHCPGRIPAAKETATPSARRAALRPGTGPSLACDVLLLTQRQNE